MNCNEQNTHPRDARLRFRASDHSYFVDDTPLRPVTSVVESCFPDFDVDYWAPRKAVQLGVTEAEVRRMWEERGRQASALGTQMHANIERYYLGEEFDGEFDTLPLFRAFTAAHDLHPYRTEWSVFDEELGVAGTIDFLDYHDGVYRIYDWKRSNKLIENDRPVLSNTFGETGIGVFSHVPDTAFWHYALQVSIYRYILARKYGINVESCHLVVLHPNNRKPYVLTTPYLQRELQLLFGQC